MKKIFFIASLILLPPLFGCSQPQVKYVKQLENEYDRLESLQTSLESELSHAQDPLKVEDYLSEVELRMRLIDNEIINVDLMEN